MKNQNGYKTVLAVLGMVLLLCGCGKPRVVERFEVPGARVAILVGEGFHDGEALVPMAFLVNRGASVTVIGVMAGEEVKAYNSDITLVIDKAVSEVSVDDFEALIIPGGKAPALIRENEQVVAFTRAFFESGKPTAAICHGPQVLVRAGVLDGFKGTSFSGMRDEMESAGVIFKDTSVVVDRNLITSRIPVDLSDFCKAIEEALF